MRQHFVSQRYMDKWANNEQVFVLFNPPKYTNENAPIKTNINNIAVQNNYNSTQENEDEVTKIELGGLSIVDNILNNKSIPNSSELNPLYRLIALFLFNNPIFRQGSRDAIIKSIEQILKACVSHINTENPNLQERIAPEKIILNPKQIALKELTNVSLQIANNNLYPYIKENFRFKLLWAHREVSFITSEIPVLCMPPSNNYQDMFKVLFRTTEVASFYENGSMATIKPQIDSKGYITGVKMIHPKSFLFDEGYIPINEEIAYEYLISKLNIYNIYFPISPQLALFGINTKMRPDFFFFNISNLMTKNDTLNFNAWMLNNISNHTGMKAISNNPEILKQSAIHKSIIE